MAAKKAASMSRTSKKGSSKTNLKWWYVLPVIAIVVVAGYAIVRFSQAGALMGKEGVKSRENGKLYGGVKDIIKGNAQGIAREVGNTPVWAKWGIQERGTMTKFCARVFLAEQEGAYSTAELTLHKGNGPDGSRIAGVKTVYGKSEYKDICTPSLGTEDKLSILGSDVSLKVKKTGGFVSVVGMWIEQ